MSLFSKKNYLRNINENTFVMKIKLKTILKVLKTETV